MSNLDLIINNRLCCINDKKYPSRTRDYFLQESKSIVFKKPDNENIIENMKKLYEIFNLKDSYHIEFQQVEKNIIYSLEYFNTLKLEEITELLTKHNFKIQTIYSGDGSLTLDILEI